MFGRPYISHLNKPAESLINEERFVDMSEAPSMDWQVPLLPELHHVPKMISALNLVSSLMLHSVLIRSTLKYMFC